MIDEHKTWSSVAPAVRVMSHIKVERAASVKIICFGGRGPERYVTVEFVVGNNAPEIVNLRVDDTFIANLDLDITNDV